MTLQEAIKTIAIYDGWTTEGKKWVSPNGYFETYSEGFMLDRLKYHTSADSLLPVWRKVRDEMITQVTISKHYELRHIGYTILNGNLEHACIELAGIIESIKQKQ